MDTKKLARPSKKILSASDYPVIANAAQKPFHFSAWTFGHLSPGKVSFGRAKDLTW